MDESDGSSDSILKHQSGKDKRQKMGKKLSDLHWTYGTRVIPV